MRLSGGQVQRAAAARMFVRDAELLVFDDLSERARRRDGGAAVGAAFARGRDVTCLVVSHRPAALRRADQVLLMEAGRLVARGTLEATRELGRDAAAVAGRAAPTRGVRAADIARRLLHTFEHGPEGFHHKEHKGHKVLAFFVSFVSFVVNLFGSTFCE